MVKTEKINFSRNSLLSKVKRAGTATAEYAILLAMVGVVGGFMLGGSEEGIANGIEKNVVANVELMVGSTYDENGFDKNGYDRNGFNAEGIHKDTGTKWDSDGFNQRGYNELGLDKDGNQVVVMLDGSLYYWLRGGQYNENITKQPFGNQGDYREITSIDVSGYDTSNVDSMQGTFYGESGYYGGYNSKLEEINGLETWDTSNVTNMDNMFSFSGALLSLDLSSFDTSKVTHMGNMFYHCESLQSVDVSNFDTSNVTTMISMFNNCKALQSVDVSNFDTSKVTSMNGMFASCNALTSLDLSNFDTSKVTTMGTMFSGCSNLEIVKLGGPVWQHLGDSGVFSSCSKLTQIQVPQAQLAEYQEKYAGKDFASKFVGY